jgi:nucleoside-diphosphate-sugar epimerase
MRVLVTGAAGFLGGHCATELLRRGHEVVTTDRRGTVACRGDLADRKFIATLPDVDTVVHAAGVQYISPDLPLFSRRPWFQRNNVEATRNLVDRYRDDHIVYVSTSMTYAQHGGPLGAGTPREAHGPYSASKLLAESYVTAHASRAATIIPCIIAGDGRGGLFVPFVTSMRRFGFALVPGSGRTKVNLVHVEDVSGLIALVVETRAQGTFNAGGPDAVSLLDWVDEIEQVLDLPAVRRLTIPFRAVQGVSACLAYRPLAQEQVKMLKHDHVLSLAESGSLGWRPRWTNREIVRDTVRALARPNHPGPSLNPL